MTADNTLFTEQMAAMLECAPVGVTVSSAGGHRLLYRNRLAQQIFASADDGIWHAPLLDAVRHPTSSPQVCFYAPAQRWYQITGQRIDWAGQDAQLAYLSDVTAQMQKGDWIRDVEQEILSAFHSLNCGLCIYQLENGQALPVFHNHAFEKITGYSETQIRSAMQLSGCLNVHPEDAGALQSKINALVQSGQAVEHTHRLWNDREQAYHWIHLGATRHSHMDGHVYIYSVCENIDEQKRLEIALTDASNKLQDIINAIPGGVAIYKTTDGLAPVYFSDGVPALSGYTGEEYGALTDASALIYPKDRAQVLKALQAAIQSGATADIEFRKFHRDGYFVWVHMQAKLIGESDGVPLLQCVFHNISALRETQRELGHLVNSIPGGIASYRVEGDRFIPTYFSDGAMALSGHTRTEYNEMTRFNALDLIYKPDRERVFKAAKAAFESGEVLNISYRMHHKDGHLLWIHLNGQRMEPLTDGARFYTIFTRMFTETCLPPDLANETADGIYIIDKYTHELLYADETKQLFSRNNPQIGQKCYTSLHGLDAPCAFCPLKQYGPDGLVHEMTIPGSVRTYSARFKETIWNGIPAYVQFIRDVTDEMATRREKARLELYFQTLIKNLPGGIAVLRCYPDGAMLPEYISDGFAEMTRMSIAETMSLYEKSAFGGMHPDDIDNARTTLNDFVHSDGEKCALEARFLTGDGSYLWCRVRISTLRAEDGALRLHCIYTDISQTVEERASLRRQYDELLVQHYRTPGPDTLVLGHCNISKNKIQDIWDSTGSNLLATFGTVREDFFTGISTLVPDAQERRAFTEAFLNAPLLEAFAHKKTESTLKCYIEPPNKPHGCYALFKINMIAAPDTGDVTGILSVTDVTNQTISEQILRRLSVTSHDYVIDLDVRHDTYTVLTCNPNACRVPAPHGQYSARVAFMAKHVVVPRDRESYARALDLEEMTRRLKETGLYTFAYWVEDEAGDIRAKNTTVSAIDLRLGRVSLVCTDITDSVREQQSLLNILAYTFELCEIINVYDKGYIQYTPQMVLENLPPYSGTFYSDAQDIFQGFYRTPDRQGDAHTQLRLETMLQRLEVSPAGYEFVLPYQTADCLRYKQITVLWGDRNRRTVCMVWADVTEMLATERQAKSALEKALALAEEANRAKSDFLSAMSHDIRTPMNAIMGMTALATAHQNDAARVADYLQKISISCKHLLSLINDVLDMSQIERAQVTLNHVCIALPALIDQLSVMIAPQAKAARLKLNIDIQDVRHQDFYGDSLRINQVLINLLSNAVKFTPSGGHVDFIVTEIPALKSPDHVRYRFTVRDTGIGIPEAFLSQIFSPFSRDDSALRIEGTGLGLSIARGLVELMQGAISVQSQPGQGSVFVVELEFDMMRTTDDAPPETQCGVENTSNTLAGRCFLVAEDNEINAEILHELLMVQGAHCVLTADGAQAVNAFTESLPGTYDAILMDIQMPNMNGYEAARAIRALKRPDADQIPIIALTANAFARDIRAAKAAGMTAHVAKPIDMEVLGTVLSQALAGADAPEA